MNLLTKKQVAELLHVSHRTIDRLRKENKLKSLKVRGAVRFDEKDIKEFIENSRE